MYEYDQPAPTSKLDYRFWTPPPGTTVPVGAEERPVALPNVPLPVHRQALAEGAPSADAIGNGVYDYLRQFPDCNNNRVYAELLRDAYPHFLADLGAHVVMLDHKEVDPPYVKRKINFLKILALLEPDNAGLQQKIGLAWFHLALSYTEMAESRSHLQQTLKHLHRALELQPRDPATLNVLGQADYLLGDYPAAQRSWRQLLERMEHSPAQQALAARVEKLEAAEMPERALVEELEMVGQALELCGHEEFGEGRKLLDELEEQGALPQELPAAEFHFLLGYCREKTGDAAGAFAAYDQALAIDADYQPAIAGRERILDGRVGHDG